MRMIWPGASVVAALSALPGLAASAEFCVSCAQPDAHYACAFEGANGSAHDARLKLLCISELAKAGGHATCSVDRTQTVPCAGEVKRLAMPEGLDLAPLPAANAPTAPAATTSGPQTPQSETPIAKPAPDPKAAATTSNVPPKTVQEMVEKSTKATGEALEKSGAAAGDAVKSTGSALGKVGQAAGDAAKKTWNCITSLFGDC